VIEAVEISNLRGIKAGRVEALSPLSILVGPNNSGKSTVLEALATGLVGGDAGLVVKNLLRRGGPAFDALDHIASEGATSAHVKLAVGKGEHEISIELGRQKEIERMAELRAQGLADDARRVYVFFRGADGAFFQESDVYVDSTGRLSTTASSSDDSRPSLVGTFVDVESVRASGALEDAYTAIDRAQKTADLVVALRRSMAGLQDLRILKVRGDFILHAFFDKQGVLPVPAYVGGDGFKRFLQLGAAVLAPGGQIVLLEEPECFQHPRYLAELASLLVTAAAKGRQIILSTHSMELIDLLLHTESTHQRTWPSVHRLRLVDGQLSAVALDRERSLTARDELLEDLRT